MMPLMGIISIKNILTSLPNWKITDIRLLKDILAKAQETE